MRAAHRRPRAAVPRLGRHVPRHLRPAAPQVRQARRHRPGLLHLRPERPPPRPQGHHGRGRLGRPRLDARARSSRPSAGPRTTWSSPTPGARRAADRKDALLAQAYEAYERRLRDASAVDFDDLLVHIVAILKEHKDVRADLDRAFATSSSTNTRTPTSPSTRSSAPCRSTTPTCASPATPTSPSTDGGVPISPTSSNSNAITRAAGSSRSSRITGAPRTSSTSRTT